MTATILDIATALNISKQATNKRAKQQEWQPTGEKVRGGGNMFKVTALPLSEGERKKVMKHIEARQLDIAIANLPEKVCALPAVQEETLPAPAQLVDWQRMTMDARCVILSHLKELTQTSSQNKAIKKIVSLAKDEMLPEHIQALVPVANARSGGKAGKQTLSERTLKRWISDRNKGVTALAPKGPQQKPLPPWVPYFIKCHQVPSRPSVNEAREDLQAIIPENIQMPSLQQCYRFLDKRSKLDRERGRRTGNDWRALKGYRQRDTSDLIPCEVVQCDGHSYKAKVAHPAHGRPFHPEVCAVIDSATRMILGWSAWLSESAETVADALRHSIQNFGVPTIFYTDPGSGNIAHVNAHPAFGRYARIGITFKTGIPGNSQARGLIERVNKSCWIRGAKKLPTYTGKSMDGSTQYRTARLLDKDIKKQGYSELLISWPQFLDHCQASVDAYNNRPHSSLPKITDDGGKRRYMTPAEMMQGFAARGWKPDLLTELELDDMFRPHVQVTTRRGRVRLFGNTYFNTELEHHGGEQVIVGYEPQDGAFVYVRDLDERLICKAGFEANKTRSFPLSVTEKGIEDRAKRRAKLKYDQLDEIEQERRGVIEVVAPNERVIEMQKRIAAEMELAEQTEPAQAGKVARLDTSPQLYARWKKLEARVLDGEELGKSDQSFYQSFVGTPAYIAMRRMEEDFGAFYSEM